MKSKIHLKDKSLRFRSISARWIALALQHKFAINPIDFLMLQRNIVKIDLNLASQAARLGISPAPAGDWSYPGSTFLSGGSEDPLDIFNHYFAT